jgi:hypothetical protein
MLPAARLGLRVGGGKEICLESELGPDSRKERVFVLIPGLLAGADFAAEVGG